MLFPITVVIWAIDAYLFLAVCRLIMSQLAGQRSSELHAALGQITDPIPEALHRWLESRRQWEPPRWLSWGIVICGVAVLRQLLIAGVIYVTG